MKVTLYFSGKSRKKQVIKELPEVMESMKGDNNRYPVRLFRHTLQYIGEGTHCVHVDKIPRVIFAATFRKTDVGQVMEHYNGVVLLEINNLSGREEVDEVKRMVTVFPQTMAAFVGAGGKSVKFLVSFIRPDGTLPTERQEVELFQMQAYRKAVNFYEELIPYRITLKRPSLLHSCRFSLDSDLYFNPTAHPLYLNPAVGDAEGTTYDESVRTENDRLMRKMPGEQCREIVSTLFETSLAAVYQKMGCFSDQEEKKPFLVALARNCFQSGIPEEEVVKGAILHFGLREQEMELRLIVRNIYKSAKNFGTKPCIGKEQLMVLRMEEFMKRRYEFRQNTQTNEVEYREQNSFCFEFTPVTERVLCSITLNAHAEGIFLWDKDVKRYINSDRTPLFSPIEDYLASLPGWDGKDRIREMADAVPCKNPHWRELFHRWFLCMVAHWRGMDKHHANSTSPLLIGDQGHMKSSFCLRILPPELSAYYTDSIDFSRKRDAELYLNRFALINMDEFDQVSVNQQGFLKHLLQKPVVNTRKPNQSTVQQLRRYASFIATSNHSDLLTDTSGNRRFICIEVTGSIGLPEVINYEQLYAQAISEIRSGVRYWFNSEEEAIVKKSNRLFEVLPPAEQLFLRYYRAAEEGEQGERLLAVEILTRLQRKSGVKLSATKITTFGRILRKLEIPAGRSNSGMRYHVVEC